MDADMGAVAWARSDLASLLRDAVGQLQPRLAQRRQHVDLHCPAEPLTVEVDVARFRQVLQHVLANAIRFGPVDSRIEIECHDRGAQGTVITVRDHGPGIPEPELETIFEPFVQSSRTRDGSGGTGLGLTISRKIMLAHGGSIAASNQPGGGALVTICLPARHLADAQAALAAAADPAPLPFDTAAH
jgi:signal transduction histidine kinase